MPGYQHRLQAVRQNKLDDERCREFFDMLKESKRPLIYAGGGVINGNASEELRTFADNFQIPVVTTLMGLGSSTRRIRSRCTCSACMARPTRTTQSTTATC